MLSDHLSSECHFLTDCFWSKRCVFGRLGFAVAIDIEGEEGEVYPFEKMKEVS